MKFLAYFVGALIALLIIVPMTIINGWVLSWVWLWFVVPLGVPALHIAHAIGIAMISAFLTKEFVPAIKNDPQVWEKFAYSIMRPFLVLGFGYLVHSFM